MRKLAQIKNSFYHTWTPVLYTRGLLFKAKENKMDKPKKSLKL